ncbi:MAG: leucyl/phenylalanyl-tRNA--protein transferase [Campylobacterales bacterium]|nr:leucyl/phenylalanyl-tRNA--protein transferase [Campylobacterales bacterium]
MIQEIRRSTVGFPSPHDANQDGIVAWGGDLHPYRLIDAYRNGIFPWYSKSDPILWWSPNPRLVMELDDFKLSRSLKKNIKKFTYKFDIAFDNVIHKCASVPRNNQEGTWIQQEMIEAYIYLHQMGYAHSVETYKENQLVGGLYGVVIGKVFCGESMFAEESNASKAAYAILVAHLKKWGYSFIDCQVPTKHLKSLGAKEISREEYIYRLELLRDTKLSHKWNIDRELIL